MIETGAGQPAHQATPEAQGVGSRSDPPGLTEAVERERRRLGQELHDTLAQELTGIVLIARSLQRKLLAQQGLPEAALAAEIAQGAQAAADQVHDLARGLVTAISARELAPALVDLAAGTQLRHGIACTFRCDPSPVVRDDTTATHLFCIAREAIANAVKHSHARTILVSLETGLDALRLRIRDDGIGIHDPERGNGLGQRIMRDRAGLIGGTLDVEPVEGGGTVVTCAFPKIFPFCPPRSGNP